MGKRKVGVKRPKTGKNSLSGLRTNPNIPEAVNDKVQSIFNEYEKLVSGTPSMRVNKMAMLRALERTYGIITPALTIAGVARTSHYEWQQNDPNYRKAVEELTLLKKDFAEYQLFKLASRDIPQAVLELNKKLNRDRGYGDKLDVGIGVNPGTHNLKVFIPHNGRDDKNTVTMSVQRDDMGSATQKAS